MPPNLHLCNIDDSCLWTKCMCGTPEEVTCWPRLIALEKKVSVPSMSVILQRLTGASSKKLQQTSMKPEHTRLGSLKAGSKHSLHTAHIPKQHGSSNDPRQKGVWSWWTFKRFRYQGQFTLMPFSK
jgi:hypothetical protein